MKESRKNSWIFYTWKYKTVKDWSESEGEEQSKICKEGATEGVLKKRCFLKFYKFHRKKPLLESLFNKITGLKACNFIKKRFRLSCFPAKSAKFCYFEEHLKTTTSVYTFLSRVISSIFFFLISGWKALWRLIHFVLRVSYVWQWDTTYFSSSDWSTLDFSRTDVITVL